MNRKERKAAEAAAKAAAEAAAASVTAPETTEVPFTADEAEAILTTHEAEQLGADGISGPVDQKDPAETEAEDALLGKPGVETPGPTETARAKGNRKHAVGSAVDGTVFALGGDRGEPKARPNTLAGALYDELKVNGAGTCSELVDRLNRDGVYERVALKSATLRPYSSVMYWLKTWRGEGLVSVVIPGAEAPAETVEQVA